MIIGLTGGIASGKSTVSLLLKEKGAVIIDADKVAKKIMEPGKPAWTQVVEYFGKEILKGGQEIDRKKLGNIVFSNQKQLEVLNRITHPKIVKEIKKQLEYYKKSSERVIILDGALLLEIGLNALVDEVWLVAVDEKIQLERLLARDIGLDEKAAMDRINSQMPLKQKLKYADRVIDNSGSIKNTNIQLDKIWREMLQSWQKESQ